MSDDQSKIQRHLIYNDIKQTNAVKFHMDRLESSHFHQIYVFRPSTQIFLQLAKICDLSNILYSALMLIIFPYKAWCIDTAPYSSSVMTNMFVEDEVFIGSRYGRLDGISDVSSLTERLKNINTYKHTSAGPWT